MRQFTLLFVLTLMLTAGCTFAADKNHVKLTKLDDRVKVEIDGKLFTNYIFTGYAKPVCYPILGPDQTPMTRRWPLEDAGPGEKQDHPHHKSLWFGHQLVNDIDFWAENKGHGTEVHQKFVKVEGGDQGVITTENNWLGPDGKLVCTDTRTLTFSALDNGDRVIDYSVTMHAVAGDIRFGDQKDGLLGIRTRPELRIDRGADAVNSEGVTGKDMWGKRATWVDYSVKLDGKMAGVAFFDSPNNVRHPTWWHARAYGLCSANPFGISFFENKPRGAGDMTVKSGDSITFTYRLIFHAGDAKTAGIDQRYQQYAAQQKN
ncbi:hypothetical protein HED60_00855 [Planctomycetales bacterium ZRK34]|nr:hypothetical protein HED60_00855 [Planctomycetales bacterium ZRK34]